MEIHFLGTSSGVPSKTRNTSATAVTFDRTKSWCLVDCGEATQHQLQKSELSIFHLDLICISHVHGDHCYGLPGLLSSMSMNNKRSAVHIIAPNSVIQWLHCTFSMSKTSLSFDLFAHSIEDITRPLSLAFCSVDIVNLKHRVPSYGFKLSEVLIPKKLKLAKLKANNIPSGKHYNALQKGQDIIFNNTLLLSSQYTYLSWQPRRVIICGDNEKPGLLSEYSEDIDVLVHEATFTQSDLHRIGFHTGHSDAKRIAEFAQSKSIETLILTHFSVRYHSSLTLQKLRQEAKLYFEHNLVLAEDFLTFKIDKKLNNFV